MFKLKNFNLKHINIANKCIVNIKLFSSSNKKLLNFDFKSFIDNFEYHTININNRKSDININLLKDYYDKYNKLNSDLNSIRMKLNENNKK